MKLRKDKLTKKVEPPLTKYDYDCGEMFVQLIIAASVGAVYDFTVCKHKNEKVGTQNKRYDEFNTKDPLEAWKKFEEYVEQESPQPKQEPKMDDPKVTPYLAMTVSGSEATFTPFFVDKDGKQQETLSFTVPKSTLPKIIPEGVFAVDWKEEEVPQILKADVLLMQKKDVEFDGDKKAKVFLFAPKSVTEQGGETNGEEADGIPQDSDEKQTEKNKPKKDSKNQNKKDSQPDKQKDKSDEDGGEGDDDKGNDGEDNEDDEPNNSKEKGDDGEGDENEDPNDADGDGSEGKPNEEDDANNGQGKGDDGEGNEDTDEDEDEGDENDNPTDSDGETDDAEGDEQQDAEGKKNNDDFGKQDNRDDNKSKPGNLPEKQTFSDYVSTLSEITGVSPSTLISTFRNEMVGESFLLTNNWSKIKKQMNLPSDKTARQFSSEIIKSKQNGK